MAIPLVVRQALRELKEMLGRQLGPRLVELKLFGSFARGEAGPDSDVDVVVVVEEVTWADRRRIIDLATDVGLPRGLLISPTVFDRKTFEEWRSQKRPLAMAIDEEGLRP